MLPWLLFVSRSSWWIPYSACLSLFPQDIDRFTNHSIKAIFIHTSWKPWLVTIVIINTSMETVHNMPLTGLFQADSEKIDLDEETLIWPISNAPFLSKVLIKELNQSIRTCTDMSYMKLFNLISEHTTVQGLCSLKPLTSPDPGHITLPILFDPLQLSIPSFTPFSSIALMVPP